MSSYNQYTYKRKQDEEDMDERDKAKTTKALDSDSRIVPKCYETLSEALAEQMNHRTRFRTHRTIQSHKVQPEASVPK